MYNLVFLILIMVVPFYSYFNEEKIERMIKKNTLHLKNKDTITSYLFFIFVVVMVNLVLYSSTIPNLMAGYLYGLYKGSVLTLIGCIISSIITFFMGKNTAPSKLFKKGIFKNFYKKITDEKVSTMKKLELVILSRLSPLAPYHLFTFFWSFIDIEFLIFIIGSIIGVIPSLVLDTYIGSKLTSLDNLKDKHFSLKNLPIEQAGGIFISTLVIMYMVYRRIKQL